MTSQHANPKHAGITAAPVRGRARACVTITAVSSLAILCGCSPYRADRAIINDFARGEFADARIAAINQAQAVGDRDRTLYQMKALLAALADGTPAAAERPAREIYQTLRTAGINEGTTPAAFLTTEDSARTFKGEPFEQAMAYCYVGILDGLTGDWGNLRAGVNNSLFTLRGFAGVAQPRAGSMQNTSEGERSNAAANDPTLRGVPVPTDFELGYTLKAIAARQLNEPEEAKEAAAQLAQINPALQEFSQLIVEGTYNTVLIVDFGTAPEKFATGSDSTIAAYRTTTPSTNDQLRVVAGSSTGEFPLITDLNRLARDAKWTNLEPMRRAKSAIGTGLIIAGATAATVGNNNRNRDAQWAGLGAIAAGALMKATSYADTRHVEVFPQRVYVALLNLPAGEGSSMTVQVERFPESRVILPSIAGPALPGPARLHYLRLPMVSTNWATTGRWFYLHDFVPSPPAASIPYILGGTCVRTPSDSVLDSYHRAGVLREITSVQQLRELYELEGIKILQGGPNTQPGAHIFERGTWLFSPLPASAGALRLFARPQSAYVPKSPRLRELHAAYASTVAAFNRADAPPESAAPVESKSNRRE